MTSSPLLLRQHREALHGLGTNVITYAQQKTILRRRPCPANPSISRQDGAGWRGIDVLESVPASLPNIPSAQFNFLKGGVVCLDFPPLNSGLPPHALLSSEVIPLLS